MDKSALVRLSVRPKIQKITDCLAFFPLNSTSIENFATGARAPAQKIETVPGMAIVIGVGRFRRSAFLLFPSRPSAARAALHPRPLSRTDNDVHYFLLLQRAQGNGGSWGGYRGCSLAPRRIIRCRYAITTLASARWKRFRFFAPAPDGR